jgi:hypothetical protein
MYGVMGYLYTHMERTLSLVLEPSNMALMERNQ